MTDHDDSASDCGAVDPVLAGLAEHVTRRLQSGEAVDADDYAARYPAWAGPLRGLLPTLYGLAALGRSVARRRAHRAEPDRDARP
jgi:serine/threonine-protein kinase